MSQNTENATQNWFGKLTNSNSVSKTLRFRMIPIGKTKEIMPTLNNEKTYLEYDEQLAKDYVRMKEIIRYNHSKFINDILTYKNAKTIITTKNLKAYYDLFKKIQKEKKEQDRKEFENCQGTMKQALKKALTSADRYKELIGKKKENEENEENKKNKKTVQYYPRKGKYKGDDKKIIEKFENHKTYLSSYINNHIKPIYENKDKQGSICYRTINENLVIFFNNCKQYETHKDFETIIQNLYCEENKENTIAILESDLKNIFAPSYFNHLLTQKGIDRYNALIGGFTKEDGTKIQGINEQINAYNQKLKEKSDETKQKKPVPMMTKLKKQILGTSSSSSVIPEKFESDDKVLDAIHAFCEPLVENIFDSKIKDLFERIDAAGVKEVCARSKIQNLFASINDDNKEHIYVKKNEISRISTHISMTWSWLQGCLNDKVSQEYDNDHPKATKKSKETKKYKSKKQKYMNAIEYYSLAKIFDCKIDDSAVINQETFIDWFTSQIGDVTSNYREFSKKFPKDSVSDWENKKQLPGDSKKIGCIHDLLKALKDFQHTFGIFNVVCDGRDTDFYNEYDTINETFQELTRLYDKTRNYLTQKPYSLDKIKLTFGQDTLLNGWTDSKTEKSDNGTQYGGYLFRKKNSIGEYDYYLGISTNPNLFREEEKGGEWERLDYYQLKSETFYGNSYKGTYFDFLDAMNEVLDHFAKNNNITWDKEKTPKDKFKTIRKGKELFDKLVNQKNFKQANQSFIDAFSSNCDYFSEISLSNPSKQYAKDKDKMDKVLDAFAKKNHITWDKEKTPKDKFETIQKGKELFDKLVNQEDFIKANQSFIDAFSPKCDYFSEISLSNPSEQYDEDKDKMDEVLDAFAEKNNITWNAKDMLPTAKFEWIRKEKGDLLVTLDDFDGFKEANKALLQHIEKTWESLEAKLPVAEKYTKKYKNGEYPYFTDFMNDMPKGLLGCAFRPIPISEQSIKTEQEKTDKPLLLFKITNKDLEYAEKSKKDYRKHRGIENLHTMYFRELMSCDEGSCFALGAGTVFYRKASLKKEKPTHEAESPIKCKRSDKESKFPYPLYKDRRFMENQFQLHLSVTANCKPEEITNDNKKVVTDKVRAALRDTENPIQDENLRIIGIDRGERNLLYVCEINGKGEIVKQFSLNIVADDEKPEIKTDYQGLLTKREQERNENRKSWQPLENIANLKKGYLSQAVHQICKLAVDENAFIAMEDLDSNFRQKRVHVEKNVYQQFEKALIEKLNFLVFKDKEPDEPGGLRNAYQLTDQFTSFQDLPKQSGILFYVSPWYTSAIDPWTGFISRFHIEYYNLEKSKEFLDQFTDIHYDREKDAFAFTFDYKNFDKYLNKFQDWEKRTGWTVYSCGQRIKKEKKKEGKGYEYQEVYPTELFKTAFENDKVNIKYDDGHDLRDDITQINDSQFYKDILTALKLTFQMRNSNPETGKDYILSPVFDKKHFDEKHSGFFDSRDFFDQYDKEKKYAEMPIDADANGAYHIAQKCLLAIQRIKDSEKPNLYISAEEWLNARQGRNGQSTDNQTGGEEKSKNQS